MELFIFLFVSFINAQAFYPNVSTDSTSFEVEDSSSSFEWPFDVTIILEPLTPETPAIVDGADGIPQPSPLQSAVPGQPMPLNLPPPTAAPNSNQPDGVEIPSANASSAAPAPTGISGGNVNDCPHCCTIYFDYVNVYYWPVASSNTECLSIVSSETLPPTPPGFTMVSPSIYVVFPTISAGNASTLVGSIHTSFMTSYAPGELSTIEGPERSTKPFDFADLPCPPPAIAAANALFYNPQEYPHRAYRPRIDLPRGMLDIDPAFKNCVAATFYQGFDPPSALQPQTEITPPQLNQFGLNHLKRAPAHPHITPRPNNQRQRG